MGLPVGLYLSNKWNWHAPFLMTAGIGAAVGLVIIFGLKPIDGHLKINHDRNAFQHLFKTVSRPMYLRGFAATILLATGGFMLMPFSSAFSVNNLGISLDQLPTIYFVTGISSIIAGPLLGRLSDSVGKYPIFCFGSMLGVIMVTIYCHLGLTPLWGVILVNILLFLGISARMVSASALISAVPDPADRGAYMSVNSAVQQFAGGLASGTAGLVVVQTTSGHIEHYDILGFIVAAAMLATIGLMYYIQKIAKSRLAKPSAALTHGPEPLPEKDAALASE